MPTIYASVDRFVALGELELGSRAGLGELSLVQTLDVRPGKWRAAFLDADTVDRLVNEGGAPEDANEQLLLVHSECAPPSSLDGLEKVGEIRIDGARFVLADEPIWKLLETDDGFYDHLDGVEGVLGLGKGVQILLDGDGTAHVWTNSSRDIVFVDLR